MLQTLKDRLGFAWESFGTFGKVAGAVYGLIGLLTFLRDNFMSPEMQQRYATLRLLPHWDWKNWLITFLVIFAIAVIEGSYRAHKRRLLSAPKPTDTHALPVPRPIVMPVRYGTNSDGRTGLFIQNEGDATALTLYSPTIGFGNQLVTIHGDIPRLSKAEGEKFCEVWMFDGIASRDSKALREAIIESGLEWVDVPIRYKDAEDRWYKTLCRLEPDIYGLPAKFIHQKLIPADVPIPDVRFGFDYRSGEAFFEVTNNGHGAEFWAPMQVGNAVPSTATFTKWVGTDSIRMHIPKGDKRKLVISKLFRPFTTMPPSWRIYGTTEKGPVEESPNGDIEIRVDFLSKPDSDVGTQSCFVVLRSHGRAEEVPANYHIAEIASRLQQQ